MKCNNVLGSLKMEVARDILEDMVNTGGAQWVTGVSGSTGSAKQSSVIIYWRRPEEWANLIADWVRMIYNDIY